MAADLRAPWRVPRVPRCITGARAVSGERRREGTGKRIRRAESGVPVVLGCSPVSIPWCSPRCAHVPRTQRDLAVRRVVGNRRVGRPAGRAAHGRLSRSAPARGSGAPASVRPDKARSTLCDGADPSGRRLLSKGTSAAGGVPCGARRVIGAGVVVCRTPRSCGAVLEPGPRRRARRDSSEAGAYGTVRLRVRGVRQSSTTRTVFSRWSAASGRNIPALTPVTRYFSTGSVRRSPGRATGMPGG